MLGSEGSLQETLSLMRITSAKFEYRMLFYLNNFTSLFLSTRLN
jgi:hypothetical protein